MKKLLSVLLAFTLIFAFAGTAMADTSVDGTSGTVNAYVYANDKLSVYYDGQDAGKVVYKAQNNESRTDIKIDGSDIIFANAEVSGKCEFLVYVEAEGSSYYTLNVTVIPEAEITWDLSDLTVHEEGNPNSLNSKDVPNGEFTLGLHNNGVYLHAANDLTSVTGGTAGGANIKVTGDQIVFNYGKDGYVINLNRVASTDTGLKSVTVADQTFTASNATISADKKTWTIKLAHHTDLASWDEKGITAVATGKGATATVVDKPAFRPQNGGSFEIEVKAQDTSIASVKYTINYTLAHDVDPKDNICELDEVKIGDVKITDFTDFTIVLNPETMAKLKVADVVVKTKVDGLKYSVAIADNDDITDNDKYDLGETKTLNIRVYSEGCEDKTHSDLYSFTCKVGFNTTVKAFSINDGTNTTPAALETANVYKGYFGEKATSFTVNVTPAVAADVASVTLNGSKLAKPMTDKTATEGVYSFAGLTAEGTYTVKITDVNGEYTDYVLIIEKGKFVPVTPTFSITGASGSTYTTDDITPAIKYATNGTVTAVTVDGATTKVDGTPTATTINLKGLELNKNYNLKVTVLSPDKVTTKDFTYTVKCASLETLFDDLYISKKSSGSSKVAFTEDFAAGKFDYALDDFEVDDLDDMVDLYLQYDLASDYSTSSKEKKVIVTLNGEACSQNTSNDYFTLSADDMVMGENEIEITYDYSGDEFEYTITFDVKTDVPTKVEIEKAAIRETSKSTGKKAYDFDEFDPDVTDYTISLDEEYAGETVYLHIKLENDDASISSVSKATKVTTDSVYSIEVPKTGSVKAELTVKNGSTKATYTFTISADGSSDKAQLKKAYIAEDDVTTASKQYDMTPAFSAGQYDYYVVIPGDGDTSDVYFYFELDNKDDDIEIVVDGDVKDKYDEAKEWYDLEMEDGDEVTITVTVTDEKDDDEEHEYTFTIVKGDEDKDDDDVDMTGIKLNTKSSGASSSNIALNKTFAESTKSYTATVASTVSKIYVAPSYKESQLVIVNGKECSKSGRYVEVPLQEGKNTIEVVAYAENLDDSLTYTITVTRGGVEDMSYLAVVSGSTTLTLSPAFDADVHNYAAIADNSQSSVYFSAYAGDDAKITVSQNVNSTVISTKTISSTSYSTSGSFTLYTGINVFTVTVSNDSDAETYYVSVYKQPTALNITKSEQKVSVDGGAAKTLYAYNINGNNFIKIRDLAVLLNGTDKQFGISYNSNASSASYGTITLTSGNSYTKQTGDNTALPAYKSGAVVSTQPFYLDGTKIVPMAYNIGGNNYLMIRDLAVFLDFGVSYNSTTNAIVIDTDANYNPTK